MPRPPRPNAAGTTYHITARGNNRERIFSDRTDRYVYLSLLAKTKRVMALRVFAYVLMTNHVHLVLQTTAPNISAAIHRLHGPYASYFNRRHGRSGHLFGRRFYSEMLADDPHLLQVTSYLHVNPVRAGLVADAAEYPWSSYRCYVGSDSGGSLIDTHPLLELISHDLASGRRAYAKFVEEIARQARPIH